MTGTTYRTDGRNIWRNGRTTLKCILMAMTKNHIKWWDAIPCILRWQRDAATRSLEINSALFTCISYTLHEMCIIWKQNTSSTAACYNVTKVLYLIQPSVGIHDPVTSMLYPQNYWNHLRNLVWGEWASMKVTFQLVRSESSRGK
jgi:hypothetical protein